MSRASKKTKCYHLKIVLNVTCFLHIGLSRFDDRWAKVGTKVLNALEVGGWAVPTVACLSVGWLSTAQAWLRLGLGGPRPLGDQRRVPLQPQVSVSTCHRCQWSMTLKCSRIGVLGSEGGLCISLGCERASATACKLSLSLSPPSHTYI